MARYCRFCLPFCALPLLLIGVGCGDSPDRSTLIGGGKPHGKPILDADPASFTFTTPIEGDPEAQSLTISNTGDGLMDWSITDDGDWLTALPTSGTVASDDSETVSVSVSSATLTPGTYNATLTVTATAADGSPVDIPVQFTVSDQPEADCSPAGLSFAATQDGLNPDPKTLTLSNIGGRVLDWTAAPNPAATWLGISPDNSSITGGSSLPLSISVDITGLTAGSYNTDIEISSNDPASPYTVPVTLDIAPPPTIYRDPASIEEYAVENVSNPAVLGLTVRNDGGGTMVWQVSQDSTGWLHLTPASGMLDSGNQTVVAVIFSTLNLTDGDYTADITVEAVGATNTPQTVPVTLHVTPQPVLGTSPSTMYVSATAAKDEDIEVSFNITNEGSGILAWSLTEGTRWLATPYPSGVAGANPQQVTLEVNPKEMGVGMYNADVQVDSPQAENSPVTVQVVVSAEGVALGAWPLTRCDYERSAKADYTGPEASGLRWKAELPGINPVWVRSPNSLAADKEGNVYVSGCYDRDDWATEKCSLFCFSSSGLSWEHVIKDDGVGYSGGAALSPDGMVYSAVKEGFISVNGSDGSLYWMSNTEAPSLPDTEINVGLDGRLYAKSADAASTPDGVLSSITSGPFASPAIVPAVGGGRNGGRAFWMIVSDGTNVVRAEEFEFSETLYQWEENGPRWTCALGGDVSNNIAADTLNNVCYAVTETGTAVAISFADPDTPSVEWQLPLSDSFTQIASPAIGEHSGIIFRSDAPNSKLYCVSADGSSTLWTQDFGGGATVSSPVIDRDSNIYVLKHNGAVLNVLRINYNSGVATWEFDGTADALNIPLGWDSEAIALSPAGGVVFPYDKGVACVGMGGGEGVTAGLTPSWPQVNANAGNNRKSAVPGPRKPTPIVRWTYTAQDVTSSWYCQPISTIYESKAAIRYAWVTPSFLSYLASLDIDGKRKWSRAVHGHWNASDDAGNVLHGQIGYTYKTRGDGMSLWTAASTSNGAVNTAGDYYYQLDRTFDSADGSEIQWYVNNPDVTFASIPAFGNGKHFAFVDTGTANELVALSLWTTTTYPLATLPQASLWQNSVVDFTGGARQVAYAPNMKLYVLAKGAAVGYPENTYFWVFSVSNGTLIDACKPDPPPGGLVIPVFNHFAVTNYGELVYVDTGGTLNFIDPEDPSNPLNWTLAGYNSNYTPVLDSGNYIFAIKSVTPPVVHCVDFLGNVIWSYNLTTHFPMPDYTNVSIAAPVSIGPDASLLVSVNYTYQSVNCCAMVCLGGPEIGILESAPQQFNWAVSAANNLPFMEDFVVRSTAVSDIVCDLTVEYTQGDTGWLNIPEGQTAIPGGEWDAYGFTVDASGISVGTHIAKIKFSSSQALNSPLEITCTLDVSP